MNHLANEKSPYLLQHRENPVDWFPWGEEAFAKARREKKPIFLSVGYSTCHWCHVMAHESFESDEIAAILNEQYVAIKVDREERPDVDQVYMTFVQATTGQGGWPMSVWLTPDLKPIYGGTYFPPRDRWGRPGFETVLQRISGLWKERPEEIAKQSEQIFQQIRDYAKVDRGAGSFPGLGALESGVQLFARTHDPIEGGFGAAPKFPRPVCLEFLLRRAAQGDEAAREMTLLTLRKMAMGGMNDQLGGGFHRYSVDEFWHVPHYEKMLYDQGQLVVVYLEAYQLSEDPFFAQVAKETVAYVARDLLHPEGGFYSAEDADSFLAHGSAEHAEGAFYVWTREELQKELGPDFEPFAFRYGVRPEGNSPAGSDPHGELKGKNTLKAFYSLEETGKHFEKSTGESNALFERSRLHLLEIRNRRPRPHRDEKILTAWNGLMISGLSRAASILQDPEIQILADRAVKFVCQHLVDSEGNLLRSWLGEPGTIPAFAEDHAFWIQALLDYYESTLDAHWVDEAIRWQAKMDALFWDEAAGGYYSTSGRDPSVLLRMKTDHDGAEPSANSVAALNLIRLHRLTNRLEFREHAGKILKAFGGILEKGVAMMPLMAAALDAWEASPTEIVLVGTAEEIRPFQVEVSRHFLPDRVLWRSDSGVLPQVFQGWGNLLSEKVKVNGGATVYVCKQMSCQKPATTPAELGVQLKDCNNLCSDSSNSPAYPPKSR